MYFLCVLTHCKQCVGDPNVGLMSYMIQYGTETKEYFLDKESAMIEEPAVSELIFIITKGLLSWETSALEGVFLMDCLGRKSARDLGLPEYLEL